MTYLDDSDQQVVDETQLYQDALRGHADVSSAYAYRLGQLKRSYDDLFEGYEENLQEAQNLREESDRLRGYLRKNDDEISREQARVNQHYQIAKELQGVVDAAVNDVRRAISLLDTGSSTTDAAQLKEYVSAALQKLAAVETKRSSK